MPRKHNFNPKKGLKDRSPKQRASAKERFQWVEEQWRNNPEIPVNGRHGMQQRILEKFGIAARDEQLVSIRMKVMKEIKGNLTRPVLSTEAYDKLRSASTPSADSPTPAPPPPNYPKVAAPPPPPPRTIVAPIPPLPPLPKTESTKLRVVRTDEGPEDSDSNPQIGYMPGRGMGNIDFQARFLWCYEYIRENPKATNKKARDECRKKFGIALSGKHFIKLRALIRTGKTKNDLLLTSPSVSEPPALPDKDVETPPPLPPPPPPKKEVVEVVRKSDPEEAIKTALSMLLEEVPQLKMLKVTIEDGKPVVDFSLETVVSGKINL